MKIFKIRNFYAANLDGALIIFERKEKLCYMYDDPKIRDIACQTKNTWQATRDSKEILDNTVQGKVVEKMFEYYIDEQKRNIKYISYDDFRADNFSKHAPFDGFLYDIDNPYFDEAKSKVIQDVDNNEYGKLSDSTFEWLTHNKVYTVEIKSSKVPDKDYPSQENLSFSSQENQKNLINNLRKRDFFVYPKYNRTKGSTIHNFDDYVKNVKNVKKQDDGSFSGKFITGLLNEERKGKCDIYTRIFVDMKNSNSFIAYMLGYTLKDSFFDNPHIINMFSKKSQNAIYFTFPIIKSQHIGELMNDKSLWGPRQ